MKKLIYFTALLFTSVLIGQNTYLHCGKLIDTKNGQVLESKTIIVSGDKILSVEDGYTEPATSEDMVVNLKNKTVMPGFIDMHVHLEGETNPNRYLERFTLNDADVAFNSIDYANRTLLAGFTTVRDLGGSGVNVSLRNAINSGKVDGPRIFTAEKALATTGGHADPTNGMKKELMGDPGPAEGVINGPEAARKAVRQRYKNGADLIKITATGGVLSVAKNGQNAQFTQEEVDEIIKTAKEYGMVVAAHAHGKEGMKRAVIAGVQTIEHGSFMDKEVAALMKQNNTYLVPTLSAGRYVEEKAKIPNYYPPVILPKIASTMEVLDDTFKMVINENVPIAFGTDAGVFPHGDNAKEFRYMVDAGWSPMFSLQSATITNALLLDMENEIGQLQPGFFADIIATNDNPVEHIETTENVVFVMKSGKIYKK
ncbi:amidohydrolase family protein [Hanstruepera marina]|uniref:amidohydrolase family protein n=1 Tax=Hanstruepera marina TaxID=2873265 RepID=UPI001CA68AE9|nr:amidohydrolase family protein [Hanstruepera marina]